MAHVYNKTSTTLVKARRRPSCITKLMTAPLRANDAKTSPECPMMILAVYNKTSTSEALANRDDGSRRRACITKTIRGGVA